jgi:hypothetical protein
MKRYSKCYYTAQGRIVCESNESHQAPVNLLPRFTYGPGPGPAPAPAPALMKEFFSQGLGIINQRPNEPGESIPISNTKLNDILKNGIAQECSVVKTPIGLKVECNKNVKS